MQAIRREDARVRLERLKGRASFITHERSVEETRNYIEQTGIVAPFTFHALPYRNHNAGWTLRDIPLRRAARRWLAEVLRASRNDRSSAPGAATVRGCEKMSGIQFRQDGRGSGSPICISRGASMSAAKIPNVRWRIAALLFFASVINYVDRQTLSVLASEITAELGISYAPIFTTIAFLHPVAFVLVHLLIRGPLAANSAPQPREAA